MDFLRHVEPGLRIRCAPAVADLSELRDPLDFIARGLARRGPDCPPSPSGGRGDFHVFPTSKGILIGLRHYLRGGILGPWLSDRYLDPARAEHEFEMLALAARLGVPSLTPAVAISRLKRGFWRHYLATIFRRQARDLYLALKDASPEDAERWGHLAGEAVARLHDAGFDHPDLNLRNLLVDEGQVLVIDFDRIRRADGASPKLGREPRARALWRLERSCRKLGAKTLPWARGFLAGYAPSAEVAALLKGWET